MLRIRLLCLGKLGQPFLEQGVDRYRKLLQGYCKLELLELKEQLTREREATAISSLLGRGDYTVALSPIGTLLDTPSLAARLQLWSQQGYSWINFLVGGANGLAQSLQQQSNLLLSFSPLTFPHQLFRLLLLEQLYRCLSLNQGHPYHR